MSYRKWLSTLVITVLSFTLSLDAAALLKPKSTTSTTTCPDGSAPVDGVCPASSLGGSVYALFTGDLPLPVLFQMPGGEPDIWLACSQSGMDCPYGVPSVQASGTMTISKSSKTITGNFGGGSGFPLDASLEKPFKIQVAGSDFNDGIYTVVSNTGTELLLLERPQKNETSGFLVALSNIQWTATYTNVDTNDTTTYVGNPTVYMRHYDVNGGGCVLNIDTTQCEEGWAKVTQMFFNAQSYCTWNDTDGRLELPCEVKAFAGDGQQADFEFGVDHHNFYNCGSGSETCYISWGEPTRVNTGSCKKTLPATDVFELCQTLEFTITAGTGISNFWHRAWNSMMAGAPTEVIADYQTLTAAGSTISVDIDANPNPVQIGNSSSSSLTIKITNSPEANLGLIDVETVRIVFRNTETGDTTSVFNDKFPTSCTDGNCWAFKFGRDDVFCAYASIFPGSVDSSGLLSVSTIPLKVVGNYPGGSNGIEGYTDLTVNGDFDTAQCPAQ